MFIVYSMSPLIRNWLSNRVHADVPPIKVDSKAEYKAVSIQIHQESNGKMQFSILYVGFGSSADM